MPREMKAQSELNPRIIRAYEEVMAEIKASRYVEQRTEVHIKSLEEVWTQVKGIISVPHTQKEYNRMVSNLDTLIDEIGNDQHHPLAPLMETLGTLIEAYENRTIPEPKGDSISALKFLMAEHGLKQKDMKALGSQGVVSEIMNGKRLLNRRQIKHLSDRFNVSPSVFI